MIVDDSPLVRKLVSDILHRDPDLSVVSTAPNGELALSKIEKYQPDVITMDMEMPGIGGLSAVQQIMDRRPTPIVMLSAFAKEGAEKTVQALELGAVDFIAKPTGSLSGGVESIAAPLIDKVKAAAKVRMNRRKAPISVTDFGYGERRSAKTRAYIDRGTQGAVELIAIGASTGGPVALKQMLSLLPEELPAGIVIVQHMPPVFTQAFAKRLDTLCKLRVKEAEEGDSIVPGSALIAPGGYHMTVLRRHTSHTVHLNRDDPVMGLRPSVDVLLNSVATDYGKRALGVILTGMGRDGAKGMAALKKSGGVVIAQDRDSSVIYGMNREVIEDGNADEVLPIYSIAESIVSRCGVLIKT
jgi:two-component system chemotaxis response regulator CheB